MKASDGGDQHQDGLVVDAWANEAAQRNAIMQGLKSAKDDDLILISDVDEIFSPQVIGSINANKLCTTLYQNFYNYQFNLQVLIQITPQENVNCREPQNIKPRSFLAASLSRSEILNAPEASKLVWLKWNWFKLNNRIIENSGWHFSWVMTLNASLKMSTISHTEYDLPEFNNPEHIMKVIKTPKISGDETGS